MKTIKRNPFSMNCSFYVIPCKTSTLMLSHSKHPFFCYPMQNIQTPQPMYRCHLPNSESALRERVKKTRKAIQYVVFICERSFFISMFFLHLTNFWWGFEQSGTITLVTFAKHQDGLSPSAKNKVSSAQIHSQICFALSSKTDHFTEFWCLTEMAHKSI